MHAPLDIFLKSGFVTKGVFSTCVTFDTGGHICTNKAASDWVTTAPSRVDFCGFIWEVGLEEDAMHLQYTPDKSGPEIWWRVQEKLVVYFFWFYNISLVFFFYCGGTMWFWLRGCAWLILGNFFKPLFCCRILCQIETMPLAFCTNFFSQSNSMSKENMIYTWDYGVSQ